MKEITSFLETEIGLSHDIQVKILSSIAIAILFWLIQVLIVRIILQKVTQGRNDATRVYYQWKKISSYLLFFFASIAIGRVWLAGFQAITTFLGLISAGLAIALKDIITDIAGWVYIAGKRPFRVGDRIEIGNHAGDVIDLEVFQFTLMEIAGSRIDAEQSTGRMIHIPNGLIFTQTLANYSKGFDYIWNEIPILVTFESNRKKAKEALREILNKHSSKTSAEAERSIKRASKKYMLLYSHLSPKVYTDIKESGVLYTLRYLCRTQNTRDTTESIVEDILDVFDTNDDIDFAYPTRRVFDNPTEGKTGLQKK